MASFLSCLEDGHSISREEISFGVNSPEPIWSLVHRWCDQDDTHSIWFRIPLADDQVRRIETNMRTWNGFAHHYSPQLVEK